MALWLNRPGRHEAKFLDEGQAWDSPDRDLSKLPDHNELVTIVEEVYPKAVAERRRQNLGQIWAVSTCISPSDWVYLPSKPKTIHIGEITHHLSLSSGKCHTGR